MTTVDTFLSHHGVKGMKWGVRKDRTSQTPSYSVDKEGRISIDSGFTLQRVFDSKSKKYVSDGSSGSNYFAFTEKDKHIYTSMMGAGIESKFKFIRNLASDKVSILVAKEPLKSPSRKEAIDILKKTVDDLGASTGIPKLKKNASDREAQDWYEDANTRIVLDRNSALNKAYYSNLRKSGFNILLDEMDAGFLSELPIIVLDGSKSLRPVSVSDITQEQVNAAREFTKRRENVTIKTLEELYKD